MVQISKQDRVVTSTKKGKMELCKSSVSVLSPKCSNIWKMVGLLFCCVVCCDFFSGFEASVRLVFYILLNLCFFLT